MEQPPTLLNAAQIHDLLATEFPQMMGEGQPYVIESAEPLAARVRLRVATQHLRPGGTVSGPSIFGLADLCAYVAILASIGPVMQVATTNMSLNFLRRPPPQDLLAHCRLIKLGKRLVVAEIGIAREGAADLVAHATGTYSVPAAQRTAVS